MKSIALFYREIFSPEKFPQLYSKRGFEKKRVKLIMPENANSLAYVTDKYGNKINIEL